VARKKPSAAPSSVKMIEAAIVPIGALRPNTWNPNKMAPRLFEALKASILAGGFVQPAVVRPVDEGDVRYEILDGEHRWRALGEIGSVDISVIVVNDTEAQARIRTVGMNRLRGEMASAQVASILAGLAEEEETVRSLLGYGEKEFTDLMALASDGAALDRLATADESSGALEEFITISFAVPESAHLVIMEAFDRVMAAESCDKNVALERICADYLAGSERPA